MARVQVDDFEVATPGRRLIDLTSRLQQLCGASGVRTGLCTVFVHHTSASLVINENADPAVLRDLQAYMARLVLDGDPAFEHSDEGPDDMPAHVRCALTQTSIGLPLRGGQLDLGCWQAVYLWEHRTSPHHRRVSVTIVGD